jgi:hypothetical protein
MYLLIICIVLLIIVSCIYTNHSSMVMYDLLDTRTPLVIPNRTPQPTPVNGKSKCPGGGPFGKMPALPFPDGVELDLSSTSTMQRTKMSFQAVPESVNASGGILTISMNPNEKDNNTGDAKTDRRRNEINISDSSFCIQLGNTGTWGFQVRINEELSWGPNFYHIMQVKSRNDAINTAPYFTISIHSNQIAVMDYTAKNYTPIQPLCSAVNQWIPVSVTVTNKAGTNINYNVNGKTGTLPMPPAPGGELYFKCGQYRKIPPSGDLTITTSTSYKDICFRPSRS